MLHILFPPLTSRATPQQGELRDQPKSLRNIHKAAGRVQINTCKTATLVLKGHRLKLHLKKDSSVKNSQRMGDFNQVWKEQMGQCCGEEKSSPGVKGIQPAPYKAKTHGPGSPGGSCLFHTFRVVPTHSSQAVWSNLRALVLWGGFGSINVAAGNNPCVH